MDTTPPIPANTFEQSPQPPSQAFLQAAFPSQLEIPAAILLSESLLRGRLFREGSTASAQHVSER